MLFYILRQVYSHMEPRNKLTVNPFIQLVSFYYLQGIFPDYDKKGPLAIQMNAPVPPSFDYAILILTFANWLRFGQHHEILFKRRLIQQECDNQNHRMKSLTYKRVGKVHFTPAAINSVSSCQTAYLRLVILKSYKSKPFRLTCAWTPLYL